jgi:hypothetical protein
VVETLPSKCEVEFKLQHYKEKERERERKNKCWQGCGGIRTLEILLMGIEYKMVQSLWKVVWQYPKR